MVEMDTFYSLAGILFLVCLLGEALHACATPAHLLRAESRRSRRRLSCGDTDEAANGKGEKR